MRIDVLTLFPEMIAEQIAHSIVKRGRESGALDIRVHDLRDYTLDRHRTADDAPYGGGVGMVMKVEPVRRALADIASGRETRPCVALMSPAGQRLTQKIVRELATGPDLVLVCGHYEGVDDRVRQHLVDRELSIGDYVLTGGELPALVVIDAVCRLVPGVLGKAESAEEESFSEGLLEYPQYTRPEEFEGWKVPEVLLSGNHSVIARWRRDRALEKTLERRPDLLLEADLDDKDLDVLLGLGASPDLLRSLGAGRREAREQRAQGEPSERN